ncbi:MAG: alpha/beta fold hydrolase, partial [Actinomycetota bacterium]
MTDARSTPNEGRLTLRDGRTLAWREYGVPDGRPLLRFQGTPGSRMSRHPHPESYERFGVRVIAFDRPGYGASTRLPGRGFAAIADDAAELLDHLGIDVVHATGGSGGGPHVLAFAARHPGRARAITVVAGAAPLVEEDTAGLIGLNRDGWYAAHESWDAVHALLVPVREELLKDPLTAFRGVMEDAPQSDKDVLNDEAFQRVIVEDILEALRPNAEGWADEGMALMLDWDFEPADIRCSIAWWHGEHDANAPLTAVRRFVEPIQGLDLRLWSAGHFESYVRHDE